MNGDLGSALKENTAGNDARLDATAKSKMIFGIVSGMASVHARGILHRDLKPTNILLNEQFEPVIGDFQTAHSYANKNKLRKMLGTPFFIALDINRDEERRYDFSVDVYAFAVTLYHIFAEAKDFDDGLMPIMTFHQLWRRISQGARFNRKPQIPEYHWGVIVRCWVADPKARPTFQALLEEFHDSHEYILSGASRSAVLEYEDRVGSYFGVPDTWAA
jgi:serine/threonine protein kinase